MNINKINPSTLRITDMRFADIDGAPKRCTLMKLYTNQGLLGGKWRDEIRCSCDTDSEGGDRLATESAFASALRFCGYALDLLRQ